MAFARKRCPPLCAALLAIWATSAAANLIANGSFETPVAPAGSFSNFTAGSTSITGWTVVGVDSSVVNKTFTQSGITFESQDGSQWLDLSGVTSNSTSSGVTQDVPTTIGTTYELRFYVGSASDASLFFPATVDLSIDGGPRQSFTNPAAPRNSLDWKLFTTRFVATKSLTNVTFFNGGAPSNFLGALDDVALDAVPPNVPALGALARVALVGALLGVLVFGARRVLQ